MTAVISCKIEKKILKTAFRDINFSLLLFAYCIFGSWLPELLLNGCVDLFNWTQWGLMALVQKQTCHFRIEMSVLFYCYGHFEHIWKTGVRKGWSNLSFSSIPLQNTEVQREKTDMLKFKTMRKHKHKLKVLQCLLEHSNQVSYCALCPTK